MSTTQKNPSKKQIIIALDVPKADEAIKFTQILRNHVDFFKIGSQLFTASGPDIVRKILQSGCQVFLDLKFHDIPHTVAAACVEAGRLGVHMLTLHALGGETMMRHARKTLQEISLRESWKPPKLIAVTILTSMDQSFLTSTGIERTLEEEALLLARSAKRAGMDGIVCSPKELRLLRKEEFREMLFVTPGIRSAKNSKDDQIRTMTANEALLEGADYLVVGRPIIRSDNPVQAVQKMVAGID